MIIYCNFIGVLAPIFIGDGFVPLNDRKRTVSQ